MLSGKSRRELQAGKIFPKCHLVAKRITFPPIDSLQSTTSSSRVFCCSNSLNNSVNWTDISSIHLNHYFWTLSHTFVTWIALCITSILVLIWPSLWLSITVATEMENPPPSLLGSGISIPVAQSKFWARYIYNLTEYLNCTRHKRDKSADSKQQAISSKSHKSELYSCAH